MEKIKSQSTQVVKGIFDNASGSLHYLSFSKDGKVNFNVNAFKAKRPNQYKG